MSELPAVAVIAHRDFVKLLRDRLRIVADFALPLTLVLLLGQRCRPDMARRVHVGSLTVLDRDSHHRYRPARGPGRARRRSPTQDLVQRIQIAGHIPLVRARRLRSGDVS